MTRVLRVFADANILFSRILRDYVLYADTAGAIRVRWTEEVLEEMARNLVRLKKLGVGDQRKNAAFLVKVMREHYPLATVKIDPEFAAVVNTVEMDAKDRHVLAGALSASADILLTENDEHFPHEWMSANGIQLLTAGRFLTLLVGENIAELTEAHRLTVINLGGADDRTVLQRLDRAIGERHHRAVRTVATALGFPDILGDSDSDSQQPQAKKDTWIAGAIKPQHTRASCGFPMPRVKKPCVLLLGHGGHHRSRLRAA